MQGNIPLNERGFYHQLNVIFLFLKNQNIIIIEKMLVLHITQHILITMLLYQCPEITKNPKIALALLRVKVNELQKCYHLKNAIKIALKNYFLFRQSLCPMVSLILQNQFHKNLH